MYWVDFYTLDWTDSSGSHELVPAHSTGKRNWTGICFTVFARMHSLCIVILLQVESLSTQAVFLLHSAGVSVPQNL